MQGRIIPTLVLLCFFFTSNAHNDLRIGLLTNVKVSKLIVVPEKAKYMLYCDGQPKAEVQPNEGLRIEVEPNGLSIKTLSAQYYCKESVRLAPQHSLAAFRIRALNTDLPEKKFTNELQVKKQNGQLELVNLVDIEQYVAGVVQSESGVKQGLEYYKLQAIICRTYALSSMRRHEEEGFHLCDQVHCQVYKSKNTINDTIFKAVWDTRGMVIVDPEINLITATFHSNCGGQTVNAEDVWSKPLPYLRSVRDTFCYAEPHAVWTKELSKERWLGYLQRKYDYPVNDNDLLSCALHHVPAKRQVYFAKAEQRIPNEDIRHDLGLNSTYFSVRQNGENVLLEGRGFGHGVGVCQEGAMNMARQGYSYMEILHHYYTDVHLVDLSVMDFFKE